MWAQSRIAETTTYLTGEYLRLSSEDGDKAESNSITNQRDLIGQYLKKRPDLMQVEEYVDDGYTGTNFERPAFKRMMDDVKKGKINCIIVKDLSRLGRNYIEMGRMLERVFPSLGVRFIAINDNYDNINSDADSDGIIIPFKNLLNDAYCRDISLKVRSQLDAKRRSGDFVGSYAVYGYRKDSENKNKLVVDEETSEVVKQIFEWKIEGLSAEWIAEKLNENDVPSPSEYKSLNGCRYKSGFKGKDKEKAKWCPTQVRRILANEIYTGELVQKKRQKINYKIKKCLAVPSEKWIRVRNTHEAIISRETFELSQRVIRLNTYALKSENKVNIFSGLVKCGDCGRNMLRRVAHSHGRTYAYLHCGTYQRGEGCSAHLIREDKLCEIVLDDIQKKIPEIIKLEEQITRLSRIPYSERREIGIEKAIMESEQGIEKYGELLKKAYDDTINGVITKEEYAEFKKAFTGKMEGYKRQQIEARKKREVLVNLSVERFPWIETFKRYKNADSLTRQMLIELVDYITVGDEKEITITYKYQDEINEISEYCKKFMILKELRRGTKH